MKRYAIAFVAVVSLAAALALPLAAQPARVSNPQPSVNLALHARVTYSSSEERGSWSARFAVDGERNEVQGSRGWSSDSDLSNNHSEWIRLDLGRPSPLARVDIYPRNDPARTGEGFPIDFTIQVSEDASNWMTVVQKSNYPKPGNEVQRFPFNPVNARFVQIIGRNLRYLGAESAYYMQFAEIEIYGPAAAPTTPGGPLSLANSSWQGEIRLSDGRTRTLTAEIDGNNRISGEVGLSSGGSAARVAIQGSYDPASGEITLRYGGSGAPGNEQAALTGAVVSASELSGQATVTTSILGRQRATTQASWRMTRR